MNSRRWQDQFQEAGRASELSYADSGSASALFYALDQKLMPESEYFAWAQNTYELPLLRMSFFSDHQADATVWQKWKKHYAWQSDCLPLSEWDGILYVACLEPKEFPAHIKAVCLLTPPAGLKQMWMNYQSQTAFELQDSECPAPSEESSDAAMTMDNFDAPAGMAMPEVASASSGSPLASLEADLASLNLSATLPTNLEATASPLVNLSTSPLVNLAASPQIISGSSPLEKLDPLPPEVLDMSVLELDPVAEISQPAPTSLPHLTPLAPPQAAPAPAAALAPEPALKPATAVAKKPTSAHPQKAVPQVISTSIYFLDTILKKDKSPLNTAHIFSEMKKHFEKSMILAVDTLEKSAKVLIADENFQAPPALSEIVLTDPSFFRIATTTQHPYHGMVVQNAVNDQFFSNWNDSKIPDHVTLVPIVIQDHVVGLIMGFAGTEAFNRNVLQFAEKLAADLALQIENVSAKAA